MNEYYPYNYQGHPVKQKYPETWPMPSEKERDRRWQALRKSMNKHNLDFLIVTTPSDPVNSSAPKRQPPLLRSSRLSS